MLGAHSLAARIYGRCLCILSTAISSPSKTMMFSQSSNCLFNICWMNELRQERGGNIRGWGWASGVICWLRGGRNEGLDQRKKLQIWGYWGCRRGKASREAILVAPMADEIRSHVRSTFPLPLSREDAGANDLARTCFTCLCPMTVNLCRERPGDLCFSLWWPWCHPWSHSTWWGIANEKQYRALHCPRLWLKRPFMVFYKSIPHPNYRQVRIKPWTIRKKKIIPESWKKQCHKDKRNSVSQRKNKHSCVSINTREQESPEVSVLARCQTKLARPLEASQWEAQGRADVSFSECTSPQPACSLHSIWVGNLKYWFTIHQTEYGFITLLIYSQ